MATISITFDTKTKDLAVSIDGTPVENVIGVDIYPSYDDEDSFRFSVMTNTKDEETDITTVTRLVASETKVEGVIPSKYSGLAIADVQNITKVAKDIAAYLGREVA